MKLFQPSNRKLTAFQLTILFMITYMVSYITRTNYGAIVVEMVSDTGFTKSALSVSLTCSFITYGIGQIVTGWLGDHIQPKKLVTLGLITSVTMNLLIPFCTAPWQMWIIWSFNGFAQAFMWPPLVRLMASAFNEADYNRGVLWASYGGSIGTIVVFLIAPILIAATGWRSVFFFSSGFGLLMLFFWNRWCICLPHTSTRVVTNSTDKKHSTGKLPVTPMLIMIMIAIMLQGCLRDGVTTWTPSYISETYALGNEIAILTSVILPIFSMLCHSFTGWLNKHFFKNILSCAGIMFAIGTLAAGVLYFITGASAVGSILAMAILVGSMHGVNLILVCMIPRYYKESGCVSLVSGLLNSCTYVGSALSTYGVALLTEQIGWDLTILLWALIALAGTLICLLLVPVWKNVHLRER